MLHHPFSLNTLIESSTVALDGGVGASLTSPEHHLTRLLNLFFRFVLHLHSSKLALGSICPVTPVIMSQLVSNLCLTCPLPCSSKGRQHTLEAEADLSRR